MALICGDALHLPLADESVHCVVTSPPYWSLRKYPIPDLIWGAAHCAHEWGAYVQVDDEREPDTVAGKSRTTDRFYGEESRRFNGNHQKHTAGSFCRRCNAWRGQARPGAHHRALRGAYRCGLSGGVAGVAGGWDVLGEFGG